MSPALEGAWKRVRVERCTADRHGKHRACVCHLIGKQVVIIGRAKHDYTCYRALGRRERFSAEELTIIAPAWRRYALVLAAALLLAWVVWSWTQGRFESAFTFYRFAALALAIGFAISDRAPARR